MIALDQFTLTAVPLEQYFNETRLGQGTGFLWKVEEQHYLVTSWHVLSMADFFTRANLRKDAGRPNFPARALQHSRIIRKAAMEDQNQRRRGQAALARAPQPARGCRGPADTLQTERTNYRSLPTQHFSQCGTSH